MNGWMDECASIDFACSFLQHSTVSFVQLAAGLCCGFSCLAAGGTIGIVGDVGGRGFGLKASGGRRCWDTGEAGGDGGGGGDVGESISRDVMLAEQSNKLYVGLLIMLIFSEALAL